MLVSRAYSFLIQAFRAGAPASTSSAPRNCACWQEKFWVLRAEIAVSFVFFPTQIGPSSACDACNHRQRATEGIGTLLCCCTSASARLRAAAVYFARLPLTPGSNHARTTVSPHHTSNTSEQLHVGVWRCVPLCRRAATNAEAISRLAEAKIFLLFPGSGPGNCRWRGSCAQPWRQCSCVQPAVLLQ